MTSPEPGAEGISPYKPEEFDAEALLVAFIFRAYGSIAVSEAVDIPPVILWPEKAETPIFERGETAARRYVSFIAGQSPEGQEGRFRAFFPRDSKHSAIQIFLSDLNRIDVVRLPEEGVPLTDMVMEGVQSDDCVSRPRLVAAAPNSLLWLRACTFPNDCTDVYFDLFGYTLKEADRIVHASQETQDINSPAD